jgi:putative redox protein
MKIYLKGQKQVFAEIGGFVVKTDQSVKAGGEGKYPEPFTLFLASLGTCAGIYVKGFCDQRGISSDYIYLLQTQRWNPIRKMIDLIEIQIHVPDDFPEKYENAVVSAASHCAVKKHLKEDIAVKVTVVRK